MAVVFVCQYDVTNPEMYAKYNPGSLELIMRVLTEAGGSAIAAGPQRPLGENGRDVGVLLQFPDEEAFHAWHDHPDYAEARAIREASTNNYSMCFLETPQ